MQQKKTCLKWDICRSWKRTILLTGTQNAIERDFDAWKVASKSKKASPYGDVPNEGLVPIQGIGSLYTETTSPHTETLASPYGETNITPNTNYNTAKNLEPVFNEGTSSKQIGSKPSETKSRGEERVLKKQSLQSGDSVKQSSQPIAIESKMVRSI